MKMTKIVSLLLVVVLCVAMLAACGGMDSYAKKLEKAGYTVEVAEEDDLADSNEYLALMGIEGELTGGLEAEKDSEGVFIYEFDKAATAEAFVEIMGGEYEDYGMKIEQDGKIVIMGTEAAVEVVK